MRRVCRRVAGRPVDSIGFATLASRNEEPIPSVGFFS